MAVTVAELCHHLAIETEEYMEDASIRSVIDRCLASATMQLVGAVGWHPDLLSDPRAEQLVLENAADAYENRVATEVRTTKKVYVALNRMATDLIQQLRAEYGYPQILGMEKVGLDDLDAAGYAPWLQSYIARMAVLHGEAEA